MCASTVCSSFFRAFFPWGLVKAGIFVLASRIKKNSNHDFNLMHVCTYSTWQRKSIFTVYCFFDINSYVNLFSALLNILSLGKLWLSFSFSVTFLFLVCNFLFIMKISPFLFSFLMTNKFVKWDKLESILVTAHAPCRCNRENQLG